MMTAGRMFYRRQGLCPATGDDVWLLLVRSLRTYANVAVCVLAGTELSFASEVTCHATGLFGSN